MTTQAQKDAAAVILAAALDIKDANGVNISQYNGQVVPKWNALAAAINAGLPALQAAGLPTNTLVALLNAVRDPMIPPGTELRRLSNLCAAIVPSDPPPPPPPAPTISNLVVTPLSFPAGGGAVTINALVQNALSVTLDGVVVTLPTIKVVSTTKTFSIVAHGATAPDAVAAFTVTVAVAVPPGPIPLPPPTTLTTLANLIPAYGQNHHTNQCNHGPADWFDPATLPLPIPWSVRLYGPPRNGVDIPKTGYLKEHPFGNTAVLYDDIAQIIAGVFMQSAPGGTDDILNAALLVHSQMHAHGGEHGKNLVSPMATAHGHEMRKDDGTISEHAPPFMWIRVDDVMGFEFQDGSVVESPSGTCKGPLDFSFTDDRFVFLKTDTFGDRIVAVERKWAFADPTKPGVGPEDMTKWREVVLCSVKRPTSIRCVKGNRTFVAAHNDGANAALQEMTLTINADHEIVAAQTGALTKVLDIPWLEFVDWESDDAGNLTNVMVMTTYSQVYRINPANPAAGLAKQLMPLQFVGASDLNHIFLQIDVDREGTCGPRNAMLIIRSHGVSNTDVWRLLGDTMQYHTEFMDSGYGRNTVGPTHTCGDAWGHYGWTICYSKTVALIRSQGFGNLAPTYFRPILPTDPVYYASTDTDLNNYICNVGYSMLRSGTETSASIGSVPSWSPQLNNYGWSLTGVTFDYIASLSFADMDAFWRRGGFGVFPRNYSPWGVFALGFRALINSQRYLNEGKAFVEGWRTYMNGKYGTIGQGPTAVNDWYRPEQDNWLQVMDRGGGKLQVAVYGLDWPDTTPDLTLQVNVYVDQATPGEKIIGPIGVETPFDKPTGLMPTLNGKHAYRALPVAPKTPHWPRVTTL